MSKPNANAALMHLINGFQASRAIHVMATLRIADHLAAGERTGNQLAAATGAHAPSLNRLLRAVAALGVLHEEPAGTFALTPLGQGLRTDVPGSVAAWATLAESPYFWDSWGRLLHSVRTGENAFRHLHGRSVWDWRAEHPAENAVFNDAMRALSERVAEAILAAYDFRRFGRIVDVGGGNGALLALILARHQDARGVLFDQSHVVAAATPVLAAARVADRCEVVAGNFFERIPDGADAYILKAILHDWEDDDCRRILDVCRQAMPPAASLLVLERVMEPPNHGADGKLSDLNMMVLPGGCERSEPEFRTLFAAAGFALTRITPTASHLQVIEAAPV